MGQLLAQSFVSSAIDSVKKQFNGSQEEEEAVKKSDLSDEEKAAKLKAIREKREADNALANQAGSAANSASNEALRASTQAANSTKYAGRGYDAGYNQYDIGLGGTEMPGLKGSLTDNFEKRQQKKKQGRGFRGFIEE